MENIQDLIVYAEQHPGQILLFALWSLIWKGLALWQSSRHNRPWWFVVILLANTLGVLELIYLFLVEEKWWGKAKSENQIG